MDGESGPRPEQVTGRGDGGPSPRPVFSPRIPDEALTLLRDNPRTLVPASRPPPPKISALRADPWGRLVTVFSLQLLAALPAALFLLGYVRSGRADLGTAALVYGGSSLVVGLLALLAAATEGPAQEAARVHHGDYFCSEDFDAEAAALLRRAQAAIASITNSWAGTEGLIDTPVHSAMFRRYEWDLADLLRQTTEIRAGLGDGKSGLERPAAAALRRVEHLDEYARRISVIESAYLARDRLKAHGAAVDLLPRGFDGTALRTLAWHAEQVEAMVRADLLDMADWNSRSAEPAPDEDGSED